ncbi:hypothetical protein Agabi119p4_5386 [Agaricus bisporus var. burnettii]|uniref:Uncharacterized protein n=1 Tax=Agaricus bisporus var. burnettii TaxID=192524 RepID=A0A8H7KGH8_AGABI|nr:hypothetical protein Agabi119p4_5386 [Agaricus bisporus var. burnettii]
MFKRLERRLKRKEREDELGLDEDMKEVLGLNDTDSDESESDVESDSNGGDILDAESDEDEADAEEEMDLDEEHYDSDNEGDQGSDERALITVAEALTNPIFLVSLDPTVNECIVCPGKQLKGQKMVETHKISNAHERRFKQFKNLAASADGKSIAQDFIEEHMSNNQPQLSTNSGTSKRAEKKRAAQEKRKAKREKFKARQKAKKEALALSSSATKSKGGGLSNKTEKLVGKEGHEEEQETIRVKPKKKHKKKDETASEVLKHHILDPKKKSKKFKSMDVAPASATAATAITGSSPSNQELRASPRVPKAEKRVSEDDGDRPRKKHKKSNNTSEILKPSEHAIPNPLPSPPKKKRKVNPTTPQSQAPNQKSKSAPTTVLALSDESELQAQVKDIIKSASDLAKAARARALNGGDSGDETKASATKKMKKKAVKTRKVQES